MRVWKRESCLATVLIASLEYTSTVEPEEASLVAIGAPSYRCFEDTKPFSPCSSEGSQGRATRVVSQSRSQPVNLSFSVR